jgi:lipopolysaccharide export system permease protein
VTRFDRYILAQLLKLTGFFTLLLVALYLVNRAVAVFEQLLADGQTALVFLELTALSLPYVVTEVAPVAAFAASAYVANRMIADSEFVVMQATGFSPARLSRAAFLHAGIIALVLGLLGNVAVPLSRAALADRQAAITADVTARFLREGTFQFPAEGVAFYVRHVTPEGALRGIYLSDARDPDRRFTYTAHSAVLSQTDEGPRLLLVDGMIQVLTGADRRLAITRFADLSYDLSGILSADVLRARDVGALSTATLLRASDETVQATGATRAELIYRGHTRLAQPFLASAAALIGFSALLLGAFSRFGLWRQLLGATLLFVGVYVAGNTAESFGIRDERLWPLAWLSTVLGALVPAVLLWLAQRPRPVRRPPAAAAAAAAGGAAA